MAESPPTRRRLDVALMICFAAFGFTSIVLEQWIVLGVDLRRASDPFGRMWHFYASSWDPLLLDAPIYMRVMFGIDAYLFGPFYLVLLYAFARRRNWIRLPALMWSAAMIYSVVVYDLIELLERPPGTDLAMVFLISAPYRFMPFVLIYRLRHAVPFRQPLSSQ